MPTSIANNNAERLRGADNRSGGPVCEAQDLKRILTLLADQVADADRRHTDALAQLQERLGQLGDTAQSLKGQMPQEMLPVMDRIQDGMATLSEQIANAAAQRAPAAHEAAVFAQTEPEALFTAVPTPVPAPIVQPASLVAYPVVMQPAQSLAPPSVEAAPALRSALAADALDAFARRAHSNRTGANSGIDHFDVVGSDGPRAEPSWDAVAAEALARHYGSPASHPAATETEIAEAIIAEQTPTPDAPLRTTPAAPVLGFQSVAPVAYVPGLSPPPVVATPELSTAELAAEMASLQSKAFEGERRWLEDRFGDIAKRLEASLKDLDPAGPIGSIDERFTLLERRLTDAMSGAAKTTDLAGLKTIEAQVEDLTAQLDTVQNHFSRLDSIEFELRSLAERLHGDNLAKLVPMQPVAAGPDQDELAEAVADRVMQAMPRFGETIDRLSERLSADKIAALVSQARSGASDADAIARIVAEQIDRNLPRLVPASSDAGVVLEPRLDELRDMLESFVNEQRHGDEQTNTMLDTMQQAMIRLLDRMETIEQIALSQPVEPEAEPEPARQHFGHAHQGELRGGVVSDRLPQRLHDEPSPAPLPASLQNLREVPLSPQSQPQPTMRSEPVIPAQAPTAPPRPMPVPVPPDSQTASASSREDLVASARRAARMASEPMRDTEDDDAAPQKPRRSSEGPAAGAVKPRRQMSKVSMALLCLVAVGASFALVKATILAPGSGFAPRANAPSAVQQATPQKAPAKTGGALQNLDDADVIIEEERRGGQQRRSQAPSQSGGNAERDFATAFDGGPGSAVPASQLQNYGGFTPAMSEFARQNIPAAGGPVPTQTALTKDKPAGAASAKPNDPLPLTIGPNSLRAAASKGDPSAEFEIGARFAEGRGVPQDLDQAIAWYQKSAAQGFGPAQYRLGSMYERGLGVKADMARARVWYQRAAEQGIVKAMHNLAVLTAGRDNNATDYEAAAKWFQAASEFGLTDSQFNLAIMFDSGLGVPRDPKLAYRYFSLAARSGDDEAARRRETLRAKLQPQEIAEVDGELQKWRPRSADQAINDPRMAGEGWKSRTR